MAFATDGEKKCAAPVSVIRLSTFNRMADTREKTLSSLTVMVERNWKMYNFLAYRLQRFVDRTKSHKIKY